MPDLNSFQNSSGLLKKILEYENKNDLTVGQKKQAIENARQYKQQREKLLQKQIAKERSTRGLLPCLKAGCPKFFRDNLTMNKHIEKCHKIFSDLIGNRLFNCTLCDTSYLKEAWLEKYTSQCYERQKRILQAQGLYPEEDREGLNSEEEMEYLEAKNYN